MNRKKKNWNKRINGVSVQLSSAVIGKVVYQEGQAAYRFEELGALGKEVTIYGSADNPVQLAEVEVFGSEVTLHGETREVAYDGGKRTISCKATGISRQMKIKWSGWEADQDGNFEPINGEYDTETEMQVGKLIIEGAANQKDKTYTCTMSSEKQESSESLSVLLALQNMQPKGLLTHYFSTCYSSTKNSFLLLL